MNVYGLSARFIILVVVLYTIGLTIRFWRQQLRAGAVFTLVIAVLIMWSAYYIIYQVE